MDSSDILRQCMCKYDLFETAMESWWDVGKQASLDYGNLCQLIKTGDEMNIFKTGDQMNIFK